MISKKFVIVPQVVRTKTQGETKGKLSDPPPPFRFSLFSHIAMVTTGVIFFLPAPLFFLLSVSSTT